MSFPHGRDKPPIMLFGPGCGYSGPPDALGAGLGDAPVVGLATPANTSDPLLTHWVKDPQNPLAFAAGSPPCSFAGRAWSGPKGEHWSMLCTANGTRARYTAPAAAAGPGSALHGPWTLVDGDCECSTPPCVFFGASKQLLRSRRRQSSRRGRQLGARLYEPPKPQA